MTNLLVYSGLSVAVWFLFYLVYSAIRYKMNNGDSLLYKLTLEGSLILVIFRCMFMLSTVIIQEHNTNTTVLLSLYFFSAYITSLCIEVYTHKRKAP